MEKRTQAQDLQKQQAEIQGEPIIINNRYSVFGPVESYKKLRTNLLYTENLNVIAVTSTIPDEGKTVTSFNLACSFASMGKKVVLVDCDMRKSSLRGFLMIKDHYKGLSEALTRQSSQCVKATNIENLYLVLSGKKPPNPTEILISPIFDKLINDLSKEFDYVILDTPPVTVASDAAVIGRKVQGVVLVVRNEFASKKAIKRAQYELENNGSRIVGVVLNRVKKNQVDYSDYGYDKYYY